MSRQLTIQAPVLFTAAVIGIMTMPAYPQSINVSYQAGVGQRNVFYNGAAVPDGNAVKIGFFNAAFNVSANAAICPR